MTKYQSIKSIIVWSCTALLVVMFLVAIAQPREQNQSHVKPGDTVRFNTPTMVGATADDFASVVMMAGTGDKLGGVDMLARGQAFYLESGTTGRILALKMVRAVKMVEVRLTSGNFAGMVVWANPNNVGFW